MANNDFKNIQLPGVDLGNQGNVTTNPNSPSANPINSGRVTKIQDPRSIVVSISSPTPIVILFGPRNGGKTTCLIRLTRWLLNEGYRVEPKRDFRLGDEYREQCDQFTQLVYNHNAPMSTDVVGFMLLAVYKNGKEICQLLEAPGEHYFDENIEDLQPLPYQNTINAVPNSKTWLFFLERDGWHNQEIRTHYARTISRKIGMLDQRDRIILVSQKADQFYDCFDQGRPRIALFEQQVRQQYRPAFSNLSNRLFSNGRSYEFTVFSSGSFVEAGNGLQTYTPSNDFYPRMFWRKIMDSIRG